MTSSFGKNPDFIYLPKITIIPNLSRASTCSTPMLQTYVSYLDATNSHHILCCVDKEHIIDELPSNPDEVYTFKLLKSRKGMMTFYNPIEPLRSVSQSDAVVLGEYVQLSYNQLRYYEVIRLFFN